MLRRNKSGTTNAAAQLDNANHAGVVAVIAAMLCGDFCERVLRVAAVFFWGGVLFAKCFCCMTPADRNDLMPTKEKLEWVTLGC